MSLVKNTTFVNNFINFSLNVTKFGMLVDIVDMDRSHDFGCYGYNFVGNYDFLSYQNVCIYKVDWSSVATLASSVESYIIGKDTSLAFQ